MRHRTPRILLAAFALIALAAALTTSAFASPKTPNPGKGHDHATKGHDHAQGLHFGVTKPTGGTTVLTVDATTLAALTTAGVTATPFGTATAAAPAFTFPITGGSVVYKRAHHGKGHSAHKKPLAGKILHKGSGLTLTKGTIVVTLSDLRINLSAGKTGRIDAKLATGKLKLATLSNVVVDTTTKSISATATLTPAAVAATNTTFGTTLAAGALLGTLVITPTF